MVKRRMSARFTMLPDMGGEDIPDMPPLPNMPPALMAGAKGAALGQRGIPTGSLDIAPFRDPAFDPEKCTVPGFPDWTLSEYTI